MKIGIIGLGRVGGTLYRYFKSKGIYVSGYYDSSGSDIDETEDMKAITMDELLTSSNFIGVCVDDDSISDVWNTIKARELKGKVIFHTSGMHSSEIFKGSKEMGVQTYSIHPLMSFSTGGTTIDDMAKVYFSVEGEGKGYKPLIDILGNPYFTIDTRDKVRYHLAGVYASNFMTAMIWQAVKNLKSCGLSEEEGKKVLFPLIEATLENISKEKIREAVSGPIVRGDVGTVKGHLRVQTDEEKEVYAACSRVLINLLGKERVFEGVFERNG